jgi:NADH-quinone oxidoreductase subunit M
LKMGGYGFLRLSLPITPDASHALAWLVISMSLIAIVYIGFVALVQQDMKKLIAYSSITHMGFVTLGFFIVFAILSRPGSHSGAVMGMEGGMVQMISHGFVSGALFLCVGVLYERLHSRQIADYGGVVHTMPIFAALMVFFAMANSGLPGTSGFVGELMVILASFRADAWYGLLAATSLILGAAYTLWMIKRVIFGPVGNDQVSELKDVSRRELLVLGSLAVIVLGIGIWPAPLIEVTEPTLRELVAHVQVSKLIQAVQVSGF